MPNVRRARSPRRERTRSAKHTAWRKNRKLGRGRQSAALYIPAHTLPSPTGAPVLVENRPHRDYYFPASGDEVMARIAELPAADTAGITHVWLRRTRPKGVPTHLGSYNTGPGYRAIVLHPWPRSLRWPLGKRSPRLLWRQLTRDFDGALSREGDTWYATFSPAGARRFFLDDLVLHEVGHHVDWRRSSFANRKQTEDFAIQYAAWWARELARRANGSRPVTPSRR